MISSDDEIDEQIRERIRSRMVAKGWSQRRLALASGLTPMAISHVFKGDCRLSASALAAIAEALECQVSELLPDYD